MGVQPATGDWGSVTLTQDEMWQATGPIRVTSDASASLGMDKRHGVFLRQGLAKNFNNGDTVFFRLVGSPDTVLWREPR